MGPIEGWMRRWTRRSSQRYGASMASATARPRIRPVPRPRMLDDYDGCWVAVANNKVVAAAETSHQLALQLQALDHRISRAAVVEYVRPSADTYIVGVG